MLGQFGFSYIGLIFLGLIWVPNIFWARHQPAGYDPSGESRVLLVIERLGQVLCVGAILCFSDTNPKAWEPWIIWFMISVALMVAYEGFWIRYFKGGCTLADFYRPFLGFPAPGASLPVLAFLLLGIYGRLIWLIIASIILGVGHIGIHLQHISRLKKTSASRQTPPDDNGCQPESGQ